MTTRTVMLVDGEGVEHPLTVTGIPRAEWAALVDRHPPRPKSDDRLWNPVTFPPALIAACTGLTVAEATEFWDGSANDQAYEVYEAALRVASPGGVDWAIERLRANGRTFSEVKAATRVGIPRSAFLEWPSDDQDYVIALLALEGDTCPGQCGASRSEMNDPTAHRVVKSTCIWCRQLEATRDEVQPEARAYTHVTLITAEGR